MLFAPTTPEDVQPLLPLPGIGAINWCLLDCTDETRRARLAARGWTPAQIGEALTDARMLHLQLTTVVDTSQTTAREAADSTISDVLRHRFTEIIRGSGNNSSTTR